MSAKKFEFADKHNELDTKAALTRKQARGLYSSWFLSKLASTCRAPAHWLLEFGANCYTQ